MYETKDIFIIIFPAGEHYTSVFTDVKLLDDW